MDVLDEFNREGLGIVVDFSLPAERVIRSLNRIIEWRGKPSTIRVDNWPEYISEKLPLGDAGIACRAMDEMCFELWGYCPAHPTRPAATERLYPLPSRRSAHRLAGSATTAPSDTNGWINTPLKASRGRGITPHNGYGFTAATARTWASAASLPL